MEEREKHQEKEERFPAFEERLPFRKRKDGPSRSLGKENRSKLVVKGGEKTTALRDEAKRHAEIFWEKNRGDYEHVEGPKRRPCQKKRGECRASSQGRVQLGAVQLPEEKEKSRGVFQKRKTCKEGRETTSSNRRKRPFPGTRAEIGRGVGERDRGEGEEE